MRKRVVIALLTGMMVMAAGCNSDKADIDKEPIEQVQEDVKDLKEEIENTMGSQTSDTQDEGQESEEVQEDTSVEKNSDEKNSMGFFPEGGEILELPLSLELNGETVQACTVKAPANYIIAGNGYDKTGKQDDILLNGETLGKYFESGVLDGKAGVAYAITSKGDVTIRYEIYTTEMGGIEVEKENSPGGVDVGTSEIPGYGYMDTSAASDGKTPFCLSVQLNDDIIVILRYGGPAVETLGMQEMAEKLYSMITVK